MLRYIIHIDYLKFNMQILGLIEIFVHILEILFLYFACTIKSF